MDNNKQKPERNFFKKIGDLFRKPLISPVEETDQRGFGEKVKDYFAQPAVYEYKNDEAISFKEAVPMSTPTPMPTQTPQVTPFAPPVKASEPEISSTPMPTVTPPPTPYDDPISEAFGDEADNAKLVLKRTNPNGKTVGENTALDPSLDFGGNADGSIDRGLFQINSKTYEWLSNQNPDHPAEFHSQKLKELGINSFEDLKDPVKNIKMAKYIYDVSGNWDWWVAAPRHLLSEKEIKRREEKGIQIIE